MHDLDKPVSGNRREQGAFPYLFWTYFRQTMVTAARIFRILVTVSSSVFLTTGARMQSATKTQIIKIYRPFARKNCLVLWVNRERRSRAIR